MIWLCLVVSWMITRAWDQAKAQAASELRRGRDWAAGEFERRMAGGASGSPDDWWWWAHNSRKAWRAMKGPRAGASSRSAFPNSTPGRRMRSAAWEGAKRGAAEGAGRARARKHERRRANAAAGGSRSARAGRNAWRQARRAGSGAAGGAGYAYGWAGWQRRDPLGVCDNCQRTCTREALEPHVREGTGRTWLLCRKCTAELAPRPPAPPAGPQIDAPSPEKLTAGNPEEAAPSAHHGEDTPDPQPAEGGPAPVTVEAEVIAGHAPGGPAHVHDGTPAGETAAVSAPEPIALPGGTTASPAIEGTTEGNGMPGEIAVRGGNLPARGGDTHTYGAQRRGHLTDAQLLDELAYYIGQMKDHLTAKNAGPAQIRNVVAWAKRMETEAALQREASEEIDRHLANVARAHDRANGEGADTSYYEGIGA